MRAHPITRFLVLGLLVLASPARGNDPFSGAAVLARNSVQIKQGAAVAGDVVVVQPAAGPTLDAGVELSLERLAAITGDAAADRIVLARDATIDGDVFVNVLDDQGGTITGAVSGYTPSFLPVFQHAAVRPGAANVAVAAGETRTLAAGEYGDVTIAQTGTLVLAGGVYDIRSIGTVTTAGGACPFPCRSVRFAAPASVRIAGRLDTGKSSFVGPQTGSGIGAADIVFYVSGGNGGDGSPGALPPAATTGRDGVLQANVYAANGTVLIDKNTIATGAFVGRDVRVDTGVSVAVASFFVNRPPVADPQAVFTSGAAPIVITLTGSDPEEADLTFSIAQQPSAGTLSDPTPIVPGLVPEIDRVTGLPTGNFVQPPVTSATVTYTPGSANDLVDSFTFAVADPCGAVGMAVVDVNPFDPSPPPPAATEVTAEDLLVATTANAGVGIGLSAAAPPATPLTFSIETLPSAGSLTDSLDGAIEAVPYDLPDARVFYTPAADFTGSDSFTYGARDSAVTPPCGSPSCDTATVFVDVTEPFELAADQEVTTSLNEPVQVTLTANPGGTGTTSPMLVLGSAKRVKSLHGAAIAGNVSDADGDGLGDGRDNLPGPAPVLIAAGVDVNLGATPSGAVTDPAGDATDDTRVSPDPDLVSASVGSDGVSLNLSVRFAPSTFNASTSRASFVLDVDENPGTGFPGIDAANNDSALLGVEYLVNVGADLGAAAEVLAFVSLPNTFTNVGTFTATVLADGYDVAIPLSVLGGDDGRLAFKVETQSFLGPGFTGILDYMPDLGLTPGQSRTGIQGVARVQIEWNVSSLAAAEIEQATVRLVTQKGTVDDLDTFFLAGAADQDGVLAVADFQAPASPLPGVVMPVPPGAQTGDQGTFAFDVTGQLVGALRQGFGFFSVQGRVDEGLAGGGFRRGLQVRSTATGNLALGTEPQLDVVVTPAPDVRLTWQVTALPLHGTLTDLSGAAVLVGQTFTTAPTLLYTPAADFSGNDSLTYRVTEGLVFDTAILTILVQSSDGCAEVGRPPGCSPGG